MDIERTMQFIVDNLASVSARLDKMAERQSRMEERKSALDAQYTTWILGAEERAKREIALIRAELRRGIRLSVEENRRDRVRRREHEAWQAQHEKEMEEFRKWMERWLDRGGNGHQAS